MTEFWTELVLLRDHLTATPIASIAITLSAFFAGNVLFQKMGRPSWCPGILLAALLVVLLLVVLGIDYTRYQAGASWLVLLLGPATVALGVPLFQQIHHIRALWKPILLTLPPAATLAALYAMMLAWLAGATPELLASFAPKSVTAPIAIGITEQLGGSVPILMGGLLVTGVMATLWVNLLSRWLKIDDHRVLGFALGINGHAIGTVRAFEISPTAGAFASLGMGLTGVFTALFLPLMWMLLGL
ncbi:MAG: LrgB family protein [Nitrincola lacisaponensis]|uniref:LrgA-associated membrane protein LrgB n=1 Tax=Nitrincola lacisaponensis TaxID=267850 RepID=A0A063YAQ9_9GAMM|nr:LrgA-associated membrane protein LrgB [Nitrincola lacisaponensis]